MVNPENNKLHSKLKLIVLGVIIILAAIVLILNRGIKQTVQPPPYIIPTPVVMAAGSFSFQPITTEIEAGKVIEVDIVANSKQKSIVAYDFVMTHDTTAVEILSVESLLPDFDVYPLSRKDYFVITGAKKIESQDPYIFDNTAVARIKLIIKKSGVLKLEVKDKIGKENTQLVDDKSVILRPEVGEIKLEI